MSRRNRQNLAVYVDAAPRELGPVTRSQTRSQLQKGKQPISQPLQSVHNLRQKGKNSVRGKRKNRAQPKKLQDDSSKRRASRSLTIRENNENLPHNHQASPLAEDPHSHSYHRSRRDSNVDMVDDNPEEWSEDCSCPMSTVKPERSSLSSSAETESSQAPPRIPTPPCDLEKLDDDLYFVPYVEDIYAYLRNRETLFRPTCDYMDDQTDINARMRSILINWLIEVHEKFRLRSPTLYLTVSIVDRFLSKVQVSRSKLQLVGCVAMLLASKFEEIYPPEVQDFVYIADSAYTREEILAMESTVIRALGWEMSIVTPHSFANRFLQLCSSCEWEQIYTYYLLELALVEYRMIKYKPSELAAAAVHLALKLSPDRKGQNAETRWGEFLQQHTKFSRADLKPCVREILDILLNRNPKEKAVRKKYSKPDRQCVSEQSVRKLMRQCFSESA